MRNYLRLAAILLVSIGVAFGLVSNYTQSASTVKYFTWGDSGTPAPNCADPGTITMDPDGCFRYYDAFNGSDPEVGVNHRLCWTDPIQATFYVTTTYAGQSKTDMRYRTISGSTIVYCRSGLGYGLPSDCTASAWKDFTSSNSYASGSTYFLAATPGTAEVWGKVCIDEYAPTSTPTASPTASPTPTNTPTPSPTATGTPTPTATSLFTPTPTVTPTATLTPTATSTPAPIPTTWVMATPAVYTGYTCGNPPVLFQPVANLLVEVRSGLDDVSDAIITNTLPSSITISSNPVAMAQGLIYMLPDFTWLQILFTWFTLAFMTIIILYLIKFAVATWGIIERIITLIKAIPFV